MQLFARADQLEPLLGRVDEIARSTAPMTVRATGAAKHGDTVSIAIENTPPLAALHERVMDALREFEHLGGGADAFFDRDARLRDVLWVAGYRAKSSLLSFMPHITLGHASRAPVIEPFTFDVMTVAVCHLGRFCTCRRCAKGNGPTTGSAPGSCLLFAISFEIFGEPNFRQLEPDCRLAAAAGGAPERCMSPRDRSNDFP
jgi:hypothetical protein